MAGGRLLQPRGPPADHKVMTGPSVTAVVLAYRDEPWLDECLAALEASTGLSSSGGWGSSSSPPTRS